MGVDGAEEATDAVTQLVESHPSGLLWVEHGAVAVFRRMQVRGPAAPRARFCARNPPLGRSLCQLGEAVRALR
jgi:hypothetical protein